MCIKPSLLESFYLVWYLYRLSQEAGRRILELNEVTDSLSGLIKEKEEQLSKLKNEFSRKKKVIIIIVLQIKKIMDEVGPKSTQTRFVGIIMSTIHTCVCFSQLSCTC